MAWLELHHIDYEAKLLDAETITDLRINGCFAMEAPILRTGNEWFSARELFDADGLDTEYLREIFAIEKRADPQIKPYGDA